MGKYTYISQTRINPVDGLKIPYQALCYEREEFVKNYNDKILFEDGSDKNSIEPINPVPSKNIFERLFRIFTMIPKVDKVVVMYDWEEDLVCLLEIIIGDLLRKEMDCC